MEPEELRAWVREMQTAQELRGEQPWSEEQWLSHVVERSRERLDQLSSGMTWLCPMIMVRELPTGDTQTLLCTRERGHDFPHIDDTGPGWTLSWWHEPT